MVWGLIQRSTLTRPQTLIIIRLLSVSRQADESSVMAQVYSDKRPRLDLVSLKPTIAFQALTLCSLKHCGSILWRILLVLQCKAFKLSPTEACHWLCGFGADGQGIHSGSGLSQWTVKG